MILNLSIWEMFLLYPKDGITFSLSLLSKLSNYKNTRYKVHQTMPLFFGTYEITEFLVMNLVIFLECLSTHLSLLTWKRLFVIFLSSGKFTTKFYRKGSCSAFFVLRIIKKFFINNNGLWLGFPSLLCGCIKSWTTKVHSVCLLFTETRIGVYNLFT